MINAEQIAQKAKRLDPARLQTLDAFVDFLLARGGVESTETVFPETRIESPDTPSVYRGKPLSLDEMREAVEWEAGRHR